MGVGGSPLTGNQTGQVEGSPPGVTRIATPGVSPSLGGMSQPIREKIQ